MLPPLYTSLAHCWPLLSPPEDADGDAFLAMHLGSQVLGQPPRSLLELGSGGGGLATHLGPEVEVVLNDLSPQMLALSRAVNPSREHVQADLRTLRLRRRFDLVLLGDTIMYMSNEADVRAALDTAAAHLAPGGALLLRPDAVVESFMEGTLQGGFEAEDGTAAQLLEWHHSPEGDRYRVDFALLLRAPDGTVQCTHEQHWMGLFDRGRWWGLIRESGFEPVPADLPLGPDWGEVFLARRTG